MNRRSFMGWFGKAPLALPVAIAGQGLPAAQAVTIHNKLPDCEILVCERGELISIVAKSVKDGIASGELDRVMRFRYGVERPPVRR